MATLEALRNGGTGAVEDALDPKVDEVDTPPSPPDYDPFEAVRRDEDGSWMTTHAPPPGFDGWESGLWDGFNAYERACTPEEAALLDAHEAAMMEEERRELTAHAQAERENFFEMLRSELEQSSGTRHPGLEPGSAFPSLRVFAPSRETDPPLEPPHQDSD